MEEVFQYKKGFGKKQSREQVDFVIDMAQLLGFPPELWLSPKERELLRELIVKFHSGVDLSERGIWKEIAKATSFVDSEKSIYIYKNLLKKKGFIRVEDGLLDLPPIFKQIKPFSGKTEISLKIASNG
jgi:hypothetical protein